MRNTLRPLLVICLVTVLFSFSMHQEPRVEWDMVAKIREEGFQRSQVMDLAGYMSDVLGARLTLSEDMKRAQVWAKNKMEEIGLVNTSIEPFMDYGVSWDNEYFSLHMLEPDYQPMVGFPLTHTPGTPGKIQAPVWRVEIKTRQDLDKYRDKVGGTMVLTTPPAAIDLEALARGTSRLTPEQLREQEMNVIPRPRRRRRDDSPPNPDILKAEEKIAFYKEEGVLALLECRSGRLGAVRGFARSGAEEDKWSREASLNSLPVIAVTPEHYNRMYRTLERNIPVTVELEVRNRLGKQVEKACNVLGEIPGTDLKDEVVMIGAHFDTWHASPNSSDNTSGCAVALEAARILRAIGAKPRRTIRIALWGGEEQGIYGSQKYVQQHFGNPKDPEIGLKPDYEKFSVYFNQDYGAGAYRGIYLQGNEYVRNIFKAWMEPLSDLGFSTISIQSVGSTDHVSFDRAGLPGFQFIQDRIPGTAGHTNLDFFDTLQEDDLMKNAVIMAVFAYNAAMSDERIPRKTK
jgi:carboxypeptidase Q